MRFKIGQEVVCIDDFEWDKGYFGSDPCPKKNEIVTISGYWYRKWVELREYNQEIVYEESAFAPILSNLDEIKETLNETVEI